MAVNKLDITMMEDVGTSANQLVQRDGSGNLPAIDGSQLTNVDTGFTVSTSDPVIATNPSDGVGSVWYNKTSGEAYICTDATAGANVWTNIGAGTGDVQPWTFPGESYSYQMSGWPSSNVIDRFPFTSDSNATDVGDVVLARQSGGGSSSATYGFWAGGWSPSTYTDDIFKFAFGSSSDASRIGDLVGGSLGGNGGFSSITHGYSVGGENNRIEKYSHSTDGNSTDVGDLLSNATYIAGYSDINGGYGYGSGGNNPDQNHIQRVSYSSDGNSTDVGDMPGNRSYEAGCSSLTYGYALGGGNPWVNNYIERFQFAASSNGSDVGDLASAQAVGGGTSSTTHAYHSGGTTGGGSSTNIIQKLQMASSGNATDIADLTVARYYMATSQQ